jgi:hypothetical protein
MRAFAVEMVSSFGFGLGAWFCDYRAVDDPAIDNPAVDDRRVEDPGVDNLGIDNLDVMRGFF